MRRGLGVCENPFCVDVMHGIFLLDPRPQVRCRRCHLPVRVVPETITHEGEGATCEVRVEWGYNPHESRYTAIAIVRDEERKGRVTTIRSPFTQTDKRALRIAEVALANLRMGIHSDGGARELLASFDVSREEFSAAMQRLAGLWRSAEV